VSIREASPAEAERLAGLIREGFRDVAERFGLTRENCPKHPSQCEEAWVAAALARGVRYFVSEGADGPRGCVALERAGDGVGYLERLTVLPAHRRRGWGAALVHHATEHARAQGVRRLEVGVIAGQGELVAWYGRQGFSFLREARFPHLPFTVAFLRRDL